MAEERLASARCKEAEDDSFFLRSELIGGCVEPFGMIVSVVGRRWQSFRIYIVLSGYTRILNFYFEVWGLGFGVWALGGR